MQADGAAHGAQDGDDVAVAAGALADGDVGVLVGHALEDVEAPFLVPDDDGFFGVEVLAAGFDPVAAHGEGVEFGVRLDAVDVLFHELVVVGGDVLDFFGGNLDAGPVECVTATVQEHRLVGGVVLGDGPGLGEFHPAAQAHVGHAGVGDVFGCAQGAVGGDFGPGEVEDHVSSSSQTAESNRSISKVLSVLLNRLSGRP
ncbi:hypothetical protein [Streptomyces sp. NPDC000133]|uniref:hypothetical protein n=1 Tax=Streptomyces sp. NPDC000133 TaxID=3364535 RepID=UPI00367C7CA0